MKPEKARSAALAPIASPTIGPTLRRVAAQPARRAVPRPCAGGWCRVPRPAAAGWPPGRRPGAAAPASAGSGAPLGGLGRLRLSWSTPSGSRIPSAIAAR